MENISVENFTVPLSAAGSGTSGLCLCQQTSPFLFLQTILEQVSNKMSEDVLLKWRQQISSKKVEKRFTFSEFLHLLQKEAFYREVLTEA